MAAQQEDAGFQFTSIPSPVLESVRKKSKDALELFEKWGYDEKLKFAFFSYTKHFQSYLKDSFALDFFRSTSVNNVLETVSSGERRGPLSLAKEIDGVSVEEVPCTVLNMGFFDRLRKCGVVRESGHIVKCFDEVCGDFIISDKLRECLILEGSDYYDVFSEAERQEFIFRLFKHLQLGGRVNQYEDEINPYLDTCKILYKELLTVVKDMDTNSLSIASVVYKVQAKVKGEVVFPGRGVAHEQSYCYLIIDNIKRLVTVFYHIWS